MTQPLNPFRPLTHWIIRPLHGVRFVSHFNGSIDIEFEPGREEEVANYIQQWLNAFIEQADDKKAALTIAAETKDINLSADPDCAACNWAKDHPTSSCNVHGSK